MCRKTLFLLTIQDKAGSCSGRANNLNKQKHTCTIFTYMIHKVSTCNSKIRHGHNTNSKMNDDVMHLKEKNTKDNFF